MAYERVDQCRVSEGMVESIGAILEDGTACDKRINQRRSVPVAKVQSRVSFDPLEDKLSEYSARRAKGK